MNIRDAYRPHVRFSRQLKRRAREMMSGIHNETNALAMSMAATHIRDMARQLVQAQAALAAAGTPRRPAPYLKPAASVAGLALGAAMAAVIVVLIQ